ncbi:MAG: exodeoxyribonuclease V subunit alpha [Neptuniibacter sp.]
MSEVSLTKTLQIWSDKGLIRSVDYQFAKLLEQTDRGRLPDSVMLLSALVSHELASGNVCLPLDYLMNPEGHWPLEMATIIQQYDWHSLVCYEQVLGNGEVITPLVLDQQRVYLYRYWQYELYVASQVQQRARKSEVDATILKRSLAELFPVQGFESDIDWQKVAAAIAVQKNFAVISGGPGTGKTTTVIKLLALYLQQLIASGKKAQIRLAAPTGKAAARLSESISSAKSRLNLDPALSELIPTEATTLHRLLGVIPNSIRFRHDQDNPLHLDMLILDEASMVDLPMMSRLLSAMPCHARLILLGDRDQLASVEAGSVLGDICSWQGELEYSQPQVLSLKDLGCIPTDFPVTASDYRTNAFSDSLCLLRKSYRFDEKSGIGYLARAVNQGDSEQFSSVVNQGFNDLDVITLNRDTYEQMIQRVVNVYSALFRDVFNGAEPKTLLKNLSEFQLLCALREGPYGVTGINQRVREGIQSRGLIKADTIWYQGRPVMITQNDAALNLFNGDIGITLVDSSGRLKVWFEQNGEFRSVLPSRLPEHETVYAMTIHKSQGSEFTDVVLILPSNDVPVLSRELLYTAITRAKTRLELYASRKVLDLAIVRKTERAGGLVGRLWQ